MDTKVRKGVKAEEVGVCRVVHFQAVPVYPTGCLVAVWGELTRHETKFDMIRDALRDTKLQIHPSKICPRIFGYLMGTIMGEGGHWPSEWKVCSQWEYHVALQTILCRGRKTRLRM